MTDCIDDLTKFAINIKKTGFVHEHNVSSTLQNHGWNVINSKRYLDDIERKVREIDIVAYKAQKNDHVLYYTVLIISCKRSEDNVWCLVSRDKFAKDPNQDWFPLHFWSNVISLNYMMKEDQKHWRDEYVHGNSILFQTIFSTQSHIFAFQEMDRKRGMRKDDARIFSSVDALIKAQTYELTSLPQRKKAGCFYSFNLITVLDAPLVKVHLGSEMNVNSITDDKYIANYIVNGNDTCARIHFVQYDAFDRIIVQYNKLHAYNIEYFVRMRNIFFDGIMENHGRRHALSEVFSSSLRPSVYFALRRWDIESDDLSLSLSWDGERKVAIINVSDKHSIINKQDVSSQLTRKLNDDESLKRRSAGLLLSWYKYEGQFEYHVSDDHIPF